MNGTLFLILLFILIGTFIPASRPVVAAPGALTFTVNTSLADAVDINPGNGICETAPGNNACTLRAAIMEANASPGVDTIVIPAGTYYLTIPSTAENYALNGDLDVTDSVIIVGAGAAETIIDGNRDVTNGRVFEIFNGISVRMSHLTVHNGIHETAGGSGTAGGILNRGTLTLEYAQVLNNQDGGLLNQGVADLTAVTYANNSGGWAALTNNSGGVLTIRNSTINNNTSSGFSNGGGVDASNGTITIINSTIVYNQATLNGGGIYIAQSIANYPTTVYLYNVTVMDNTADSDQNDTGDGGGIMVSTFSGHIPTVYMYNSIVANNRLRFFTNPMNSDCAGTITSGGYNLVKTMAGCDLTGVTTGNLTNMDPLLSNLLDYGGPTRTRLPGSLSPVIDAGNPAGCAADHVGGMLTTDQREYPRHVDGGSGAARCDIGAAEYNSAPTEPPPPPTPTYYIYLPMIQR